MPDVNAPGNKDFLVMKGVIEENLPSTTFKVRIDLGVDEQGNPKFRYILGHLSGKLRMNRIRLTPGDEVQVEMSPYDLTKGRITYRL